MRNTSYPCVHCGNPVDVRARSSAIKVEGWILKRDQGGPNQVRGWRPIGKVAHGTCLEAMLDPLDDGQESLFPSEIPGQVSIEEALSSLSSE